MSFTNQLLTTLLVASLVTLSAIGIGPWIADLFDIFKANVVTSTAIGLPILTTATMLIAVIALQR